MSDNCNYMYNRGAVMVMIIW